MKDLWSYFVLHLKIMVAGKELEALSRYRLICDETLRWNSLFHQSAITAQHIKNFGEGRVGNNPMVFRDIVRELHSEPEEAVAKYHQHFPMNRRKTDE